MISIPRHTCPHCRPEGAGCIRCDWDDSRHAEATRIDHEIAAAYPDLGDDRECHPAISSDVRTRASGEIRRRRS